MEIERKFTIKEIPSDLEKYESRKLTQAYLCENPVVRIRKEDDEYYLTYKGRGMMVREEYNLPLTKEAFEHMLPKADGRVISKTRYIIPLDGPKFDESLGEIPKIRLAVELDVFDEPFAPLVMAEIEFPSEEMANAYIPETWFDKDVTGDKRYHNSNMVYG